MEVGCELDTQRPGSAEAGRDQNFVLLDFDVS
jgi:hypothetical protein